MNGTAEPEMRGLYILLTMDNDGGMEVLKYAGRLCVERPNVYKSKSVQLALNIYKVKKEYNYARFFSILRSPTTPYLYSCIMFKYVEFMRKIAFRVMSRTYGGRRRDGMAMYDSYPLSDLVHLLCFQDEQEATEACQHYNVTVKNDTILWRHTDFAEPKDEDKGTVITLRPKKMIKIIEGKLDGATRLAVCRGDVSGEGSVLSVPEKARQPSVDLPSPYKISMPEQKVAGGEEQRHETEEMDEAKKAAEEAAAAAEVEQKKKEEEERLQKQMQEREAAERLRLEQIAAEEKRHLEMEAQRKAIEEERQRKAEEERQRQLQQQEERRRKLEEERQKQLQEERRRAAAAAEEQRRKENEQRIALEKIKAEKKRRQEKEERKRLAEARKREEERLLQMQREEEARLQREEERRQELLRRRREEEERRRRAMEEQERIRKEWKRKMDYAKKLLIWRKWRKHVEERRFGMYQTWRSLERFDRDWKPHFARELIRGSEENNRSLVARPSKENILEHLFHCLARERRSEIHLSKILKEKLMRQNTQTHLFAEKHHRRTVLLCKIAVILPESRSNANEAVRSWLNSKLQFKHIPIEEFQCKNHLCEVRTVAVDGSDPNACKGCDMALFVVPSFGTGMELTPSNLKFSGIGWSILSHDMPKTVLVLDRGCNDKRDGIDLSDFLRETHLSKESVVRIRVTPERSDEIDSTLRSCCETLADEFVGQLSGNTLEESHLLAVERIPLSHLGRQAIRGALWVKKKQTPKQETSDTEILQVTKQTLHQLMDELTDLRLETQQSSFANWPPEEFSGAATMQSTEKFVPLYFLDEESLSLHWHQSLVPSTIRATLSKLFPLANDSASFSDVISEMVSDAPVHVRHKCEVMLAKKLYRRLIEHVLLWQEKSEEYVADRHYVYVPRQRAKGIVLGTMQRQFGKAVGMGLWDPAYDELLEMEDSAAILVENPLEEDTRRGVEATDDNVRQNHEKEKASPTPPLRTKRSILIEDEDIGTASAVTIPTSNRTKSYKKPKKAITKELNESKQFTSKLESLLYGNGTVDLNIGSETLAGILSTETPRIQIPDDVEEVDG